MKNGKFPREYQIRSFETNTTGNLKPTAILQYLQETAEFQLKVQDMDYVDMYMKLHKAYVVSRMSIQIHQQLHKYDHITIRTWTSEDRGANFPRSFDVYCGDQLAITAFSNWALIDTDNTTSQTMRGAISRSWISQPASRFRRMWRCQRPEYITWLTTTQTSMDT